MTLLNFPSTAVGEQLKDQCKKDALRSLECSFASVHPWLQVSPLSCPHWLPWWSQPDAWTPTCRLQPRNIMPCKRKKYIQHKFMGAWETISKSFHACTSSPASAMQGNSQKLYRLRQVYTCLDCNPCVLQLWNMFLDCYKMTVPVDRTRHNTHCCWTLVWHGFNGLQTSTVQKQIFLACGSNCNNKHGGFKCLFLCLASNSCQSMFRTCCFGDRFWEPSCVVECSYSCSCI